MKTLSHPPTRPTESPWEIDRTCRYYPRPCIRRNGIIIAWLPDNSAAAMEVTGARDRMRRQDAANANLLVSAPALLAACEAVAHQLEHGEASTGDDRDIAWCARALREAIAAALPVESV